MTNAILPNGNDLLLALCDRDIIRRKVTILGEFVPAREWFAWGNRVRKALLQYGNVLCSAHPQGVYLDVRTEWAWFRGDPKSGALEMSFDKEAWEPFPWPERKREDDG